MSAGKKRGKGKEVAEDCIPTMQQNESRKNREKNYKGGRRKEKVRKLDIRQQSSPGLQLHALSEVFLYVQLDQTRFHSHVSLSLSSHPPF